MAYTHYSYFGKECYMVSLANISMAKSSPTIDLTPNSFLAMFGFYHQHIFKPKLQVMFLYPFTPANKWTTTSFTLVPQRLQLFRAATLTNWHPVLGQRHASADVKCSDCREGSNKDWESFSELKT